MRDVDVGARLPRQRQIARHHVLLARGGDALQPQARRHPTLVHRTPGELRVLAVVDNRAAEGGGVFKRPTHDRSFRHGATVIAEAYAARVRELAELRQLLPGPALRDAADR